MSHTLWVWDRLGGLDSGLGHLHHGLKGFFSYACIHNAFHWGTAHNSWCCHLHPVFVSLESLTVQISKDFLSHGSKIQAIRPHIWTSKPVVSPCNMFNHRAPFKIAARRISSTVPSTPFTLIFRKSPFRDLPSFSSSTSALSAAKLDTCSGNFVTSQ